MGFRFSYTLSGGRPHILDMFMKDTETLTIGDLLNVESGEIDLAVSGDTALIGVMLGATDPADETRGTPGVVVGTDSVTRVKVLSNWDAVYEIADNNARDMGATLDTAGTTGAMSLTTSSNTEWVVAETKLQASDPTRLMITPTAHVLAKT